MGVLKGDFLGFTFGDTHSSELGVVRTSEGSRYTENLLPTMKDRTNSIDGVDGTYYFGSDYTLLPINFPIAFDSMSETQFRQLKVALGEKTIKDLIYDELPYKVYRVKSTGSPNLKYVCFDEPNTKNLRDGEVEAGVLTKEHLYGVDARARGGRVYKGEGQLSFTAYSPFAQSRYKYIDEYTVGNIQEWGFMDSAYAGNVNYNLYDWVDSSRMVLSTARKKRNEVYYTVDEVSENGVMVYNAGDQPVHFTLRFYFDEGFDQLIIGDYNSPWGYLKLKDLRLENGDRGIQINGKLNLVQGIDINGELTGTIYNKYREGGDFFKIPMTYELEWLPIYWVDNRLGFPPKVPANLSGSIDYKYLYY